MIKICAIIAVLATVALAQQQPVGSNKCTWGPSYFCASRENAVECGGDEVVQRCLEMGFEMAPTTSTTAATTSQALLGQNKCLWGPAFYCANETNARACGGEETLKACQQMGYMTEGTTTAAPALLGKSKCTYGPSFMCASEENAHMCNGDAGVEYCASLGLLTKKTTKQSTPATVELSDSNGIECSLCTRIMQLLENEISSNSTEAEIEKEVEKVCTLLPSVLEAECDKLIQEYAPVIVQDLLNHFTPTQICQDIDLCSKQTMWTGPLKDIDEVANKKPVV